MPNCESVRIVRNSSDGKGDYTTIDSRKFDPKTMEVWKPKKPARKKATKKAK